MTIRELLARIAGAFGAGPRARDLSAELEFHRDMLEAEHRARGLDPTAARRAARIDLGGEPQLTEAWQDQRGLPALDMLRQDLGYGFRMLRRAPGFTAAALLTLTLGIGANSAIFTIVNAVLLRPLPYADPDRLVTVGDRASDGDAENVGFSTVLDWRERSRTFEQFAMMRTWQPTLVTNGEAERLPAVRVSWNYFDMLGVRPALGRSFVADEDRPDYWRVVLLSDRLWRRRFGADPSVVGRTLTMNDRQYRVIGVMPPAFEPLSSERYFNVSAELWAPIGYDRAGDSSCHSCRHLRGFGRLKPGVTIADATAEMSTIRGQLRREHPNEFDESSVAVVPLRSALTGQVQTALYVLLAAVGFVLLIACANVANLLLARAVSRQRELAVRAALGASRMRIARQLLTESVMLGVAGAAAGLALAAIAVRGVAALAPVALPRLDHVAVDGRVLAFTAVVAIVTSLVFGLVPAWRGSADGVRLTLNSRGHTGGSSRARAVLVVADLALALTLLAGAGVMLRTMGALARTAPGFSADRILSFQFSLVGQAYAEDPAVVAFQQRVLEALGAIPGVGNVALAGQIPFGGDADCRGFHAKGRMKANVSQDPCVERYGVTPEYFQVMDIPVLAGRTLTDADTARSEPVLVISQSTAREVFGTDDPIGARVRIGGADSGPWRTIVGVVGDVQHDTIGAPPVPAMYNPETQLTDSFLTAVLESSSDPSRLAAVAQARLRELDPTVPVYAVATVASLVEKSTAQQRFVMQLLGAFAVLSVLLAAIGLYGVVAYAVAQRTREVGVRVALGARRWDVMRLVLSNGLLLAGIGIAVGLAAGVASTRVLGSLVYGVSPRDPLTFAGSAAVLIATALAAHWVPIRRALRVDPATALRAE